MGKLSKIVAVKIVLDPSAEGRLRECVRTSGLTETGQYIRNRLSIYFDTPDHRLRAAGLSVRLLRDGEQWIQSVVSHERQSRFLYQCNEAIQSAEDGKLDLRAIPDDALCAEVVRIVGTDTLAPIFEVEVRRSSYALRLDDASEAELSVDIGDIRAGDQTAPLHEARLELIEGEIAKLHDFVGKIIPDGCLHSPTQSIVERGCALLDGAALTASIAPRNACVVPLDRSQTAESAAKDILTECIAQINANALVTRAVGDPEGPHQLRVGLRRLRTAFSLFEPVIRCPALDQLKDDARWLGQEVGALRDLDVALLEIIEPEAARLPQEEGFAALRDEIELRRWEQRMRVRDALGLPRAKNFQSGLSRFVEGREWLDPRDYSQTERLSQSLGGLSDRALEKCWKKVRKRADDIETLSVPGRHELRKELKKLRYAIEFFGPIYPPKKVKPLVRKLKRLQEVFGSLNDLAMAEELFSGAGAPCVSDPAAQRAVGWVLCAHTLRSEEDWHHARALWQDVRHAGPFWR